jgi:hypothetical protein
MEEFYIYNRPFNYHPYAYPQHHENNAGICILVSLIIIIILVLCYIWINGNKSSLCNKNTFASPMANQLYNKFMNSDDKSYSATKSGNSYIDPAIHRDISKKYVDGRLTADDFEPNR